MKIRNGLVSNSSTSCFIVNVHKFSKKQFDKLVNEVNEFTVSYGEIEVDWRIGEFLKKEKLEHLIESGMKEEEYENT